MAQESLLRLPLYLLAFILCGIEYLLRNIVGQKDPFNFLPIAIVSASLGFLVAIIVNDLPTRILMTLTLVQQKALRLVSAFALLFFFLGLLLWLTLTALAMKPDIQSGIPNIGIQGFPSSLTWACGLYVIGIALTEMKARILR